MVSSVVIFGFGCATSNDMYYWGDYSDSLYDYKKDPGVESLAEHKEVLENIIEESNERNLRIPPGVCAELGYIYTAQNNTTEAIRLFRMEKQIYPESTILMDRLISQTQTRIPEGVSPDEEAIEEEELMKGSAP